MKLKYFGTDGIRAIVDEKLSPQLCFNVGKSLSSYIEKHGLPNKVIIGKDTRESGDMMVSAISSALLQYGVDVVYLGIVPTGCVSFITSRQDAAFGIMLTASHNAPKYNGIKVINNLGYKVSVAVEKEIESKMDIEKTYKGKKGKFSHGDELVEMYINFLLKNSIDLSGVKIAVDCANGSNYFIAPEVYRELGAQVVEINTDSNGKLINVNCGANHPENLLKEVIAHKCDIGFAFDGDADRLVVVLKSGRVLDGDEMLFLFSKYLIENDDLNSLSVVGTVITNLGAEESLNKIGVKLVRVPVGDRYVIDELRENNYSLGGENSGHICIHNFGTTCDALLNSLQLLNFVDGEFDVIEEQLLAYKSYPSISKNIDITDEFRYGYDDNVDFIKTLNKIIAKNKMCKVVVRPSGTESVLRILVEGKFVQDNLRVLSEIEAILTNFLA